MVFRPKPVSFKQFKNDGKPDFLKRDHQFVFSILQFLLFPTTARTRDRIVFLIMTCLWFLKCVSVSNLLSIPFSWNLKTSRAQKLKTNFSFSIALRRILLLVATFVIVLYNSSSKFNTFSGFSFNQKIGRFNLQIWFKFWIWLLAI